MSKIKEQDILKLLRGEASAKKLKALEEWSSIDEDNATELEVYQKIYDESEHLSSYKRVDADAEWSQFTNILQNGVNEGDLLSYFDGLATPSQQSKVEEWRSFSKTNKDEFNVFNLIISESAKLNEVKRVDANAEWESFGKMIQGKSAPANLTAVGTAPIVAPIIAKETIKPTPAVSTNVKATTITTPPIAAPTTTPTYQAKEVSMTPEPAVVNTGAEEGRSNRIFMWRSLAAAAAFIVISLIGFRAYQNDWSLFGGGNNGDDMYATFATADLPDQLSLSDGSMVSLDKQTTLTYFRDVDMTDLRDVTIDGRGEFDIASNPEKPFVVKSSRSGVGIRVLGTKFKIRGDEEGYLEVIEDIEGSVRAYALDDTTNYVIMTAGDRYGFDGVNFIDLNDIQEEYYGKDYDILYVLDYLMKESDWKVISGSEIEFDAAGIVNIDLDKPYEEILEDLRERTNFEYIKRDCEGCYEVRRFVVE